MGGIQSLSRSTYSKFLPRNTPESASFFGFYDVTEKLAIVAGLFSFGLVEELTGNMRMSTLILGSYFIFGRSEEHTSELQSLMRISYAVFCLKKKMQHVTTEPIAHSTRQKHLNQLYS